MPVVLDADAAFVYKAFQEAGRPAYETLTAPEAREFYSAGPPRLQPGAAGTEKGPAAFNPRAARHDPGADLHAEDAAQDRRAMRHAWCFSTAAAG